MDHIEKHLSYDADEMVELDRKYLWHHLMPHKVFETTEPMIIVEGDGLMIKDARGREFLDCVSGAVWCVNVGYGRESIAKAVYEQLKVMPYYAGTAGNIPAIKFAAKLAEFLPRLGKVFYSNSGSEANEKAFKMVRQYWRLHGKDRYKILFRNRDYHGTTIAALSATGQAERKAEYGPFVPGFVEFPHCMCYRCAFNQSYPGCNLECAKAVEDIIIQEGPDSVGAIIVEPITAGGGIIPPVPEYYPALQEICRKYGVLMIMDEVVCGFGRTGNMFGHLHFDVDPDIVTMAKGTASSYMPLSVTMAKGELFDKFLHDPSHKLNYFRDISTYGGCAGSCIAALENTRIIEDEDLCENSRVMGQRLLDGLDSLMGLPQVGDVRGKGLFAGVELVKDKKTKEPVEESYLAKVVGDIASQGVLVGKANRSNPGLNNIVTFAPALVATEQQIDRMVGALQTALVRNTDF